jgi:D-alanyl-D-alanine carboxypeptidase
MNKSLICLLALTAALLLLSACENRQLPVEETATLPLPLVHPGFSLTSEDLQGLTENLPEEIRGNIMERPEYFLELIKKLLDLPEDLFILVNKENSLKAHNIPEDLFALDDYKLVLTLSRQGHRLRKVLMPSLLAMNEAARQEGLNLMISSAYRSYDYQKSLYERYVEADGQVEADRYSARPGTSQHQLGTAMDFGSIDESFAHSPEGIWLKKNAYTFGFSLSYPEGMEELTGYMWESWHYRYISPAGTEMETEFFEGIQERMLRFLHSRREDFENSRI